MDDPLKPKAPIADQPRKPTDPREFEKNLELTKNVIPIEPGTLVLIISVLLLLPMILTGFFAH